MASTTLQMISAAKMNDRSKGFSLIEIVVVLAIIGLFMGGALGLMAFSSNERALRNTSGEIELLAKRARTIAILRQTPYALEFREGSIRLLPLAETGNPDLKKTKLSSAPGAEATVPDKSRQLNLEGGMAVLVRHWNSEKWLPAVKQNVQVWRFDPDGLCEPISIRLTLGKSWAEDTYHPLNATIRESHLEAQ